jgi:hypothetical protein
VATDRHYSTGKPIALSRDVSAPDDQFKWYIQVCTHWCGRYMVYAGVFAEAYKTTVCIVCQKRRRGQTRPSWYIGTAADLPKIGEKISDWEERKKADPGVFT